MSLTFYICIISSTAIFLAAASASRTFAGNNQWPWFILSLILYGIGNYLIVKVMRESGMAIAFTITSIVQLISVNVIAYFVFGERLSTMQYAGVGLGLVSIVLIMFPQGAEAIP